MSDGIFRQPRTRAQIESALLNDLLQKQLEWKQASAQDRNATRQQLMRALDRFSRAVLYGGFWTMDDARYQIDPLASCGPQPGWSQPL
jgi:hypothetical protein